ncbi:MAG: 3-oxoacyl-ACP reductase FabG [Alphaproteobacteria bacterium]|nr:3-oxoacyl-ACP reductase FabG [Alphaproteobacteria bacterium]
MTGLTALVTGGSRGIGRATAERLQALGATVIIHGSSETTVESAAKALGCHGVVANLLEAGSAAKLAEEALAAADGRIDILVNNAGITRDGLFVRLSEEAWDEVLTVNVQRVVELSRALLPAMQKHEFGRIINLTSIVAHMGNVGQTNYITSKAAIGGFTKALAKEAARKGVTVNAIAPGFINTDMTAKIPEAIKEGFVKQIPAQRFGEAADIANAVAFLASKEAGYVTGTTLHVNGGMYVG